MVVVVPDHRFCLVTDMGHLSDRQIHIVQFFSYEIFVFYLFGINTRHVLLEYRFEISEFVCDMLLL